MKKIALLAASALLLINIFVLSSCSDDDDSKPVAPVPVVSIEEVGEENCKEVVAGKDLHVEGNLEAQGGIATIDVAIVSADGQAVALRKSYTDGKYIGVKNTTFHEHLDIPASVPAGDYVLTFIVTDKLEQSTTFTSGLRITSPVEGAPTVVFKEVGENDCRKAVAGQKMHLEAQVDAPHKIASLEVEFHNTAAKYEKVYTYADEKYLGQTSVLFHEHPLIPADAPEGEYHIHFTVTDANGNSTTEEVEDVMIAKE